MAWNGKEKIYERMDHDGRKKRDEDHGYQSHGNYESKKFAMIQFIEIGKKEDTIPEKIENIIEEYFKDAWIGLKNT